MFYSSTIVLSNSNSIVTINNYAPLSLSIDSSQIITSNKIRQIDYIWGDGTEYSQILKPDPTNSDDPKNHTQTKQFISKGVNTSIYKVVVNVYTFGSSSPLVFIINLNLQNPQLESNNIFNQFHLIKTRMHGIDNQILYTFESQNTNNLLMAVVDWKNKPSQLTLPQQSIDNSQSLRPYNFYQPLGLTNIKPNSNIKTDSSVTTLSNPDDGSTITRIYP